MICTLSNVPYLENIWEEKKPKTSGRKESKRLIGATGEGEKAGEFQAKNTDNLIHNKPGSFLIAQAKSVKCQDP